MKAAAMITAVYGAADGHLREVRVVLALPDGRYTGTVGWRPHGPGSIARAERWRAACPQAWEELHPSRVLEFLTGN